MNKMGSKLRVLIVDDEREWWEAQGFDARKQVWLKNRNVELAFATIDEVVDGTVGNSECSTDVCTLDINNDHGRFNATSWDAAERILKISPAADIIVVSRYVDGDGLLSDGDAANPKKIWLERKRLERMSRSTVQFVSKKEPMNELRPFLPGLPPQTADPQSGPEAEKFIWDELLYCVEKLSLFATTPLGCLHVFPLTKKESQLEQHTERYFRAIRAKVQQGLMRTQKPTPKSGLAYCRRKAAGIVDPAALNLIGWLAFHLKERGATISHSHLSGWKVLTMEMPGNTRHRVKNPVKHSNAQSISNNGGKGFTNLVGMLIDVGEGVLSSLEGGETKDILVVNVPAPITICLHLPPPEIELTGDVMPALQEAVFAPSGKPVSMGS